MRTGVNQSSTLQKPNAENVSFYKRLFFKILHTSQADILDGGGLLAMSMNKYVCHVNSTCREFVNSWPSWQFWHVYRPSSMGKKTTRTKKISFGNKGEIKSSRPKIMMTWQESDWAAERVIFFNERWLSAILILHTTWHIILILISSTDFSSRKFLADEKKIDAVFDHLMSGQQVSKKNYKVLNFNFHKLKWFNGHHSRHYLAAAADYGYYHKNPFLWLHFYSFGLFLLGYLCWQAN